MHPSSVLHVLIAATAITSGNVAYAAPDPHDATAFTAHVADAIRKELPNGSVTVTETRTIDVKSGAASLKVSLDNLSSECARNESKCDDAIRNFVAVVKTAALRDPAAAINKADIRVVVRPKAYVDELGSAAKDSGEGPIVGLVAGDVWFVCVIDQPQNTISLSESRAKSVGLSRDEALTLGKKNVTAALRPLATVLKDLPPNGIGYIDGDFYESSRLLLHDEWEPLSKKLNGNLIVAIPTSDLLIYGDGSSTQSIDAIAALTARVAGKSPRPISSTLFRWKKSGWEVVK